GAVHRDVAAHVHSVLQAGRGHEIQFDIGEAELRAHFRAEADVPCRAEALECDPRAAITASTRVTLQGFGTTRDISLGTEVGTKLSLTDVELDLVTAPGLQHGVDVGGDIAVNGA